MPGIARSTGTGITSTTREAITPDGFGITEPCKRYLRPLIQGEDYPKYKDGLPVYATLKNVAEQLQKHGRVRQGYLGVSMQPVQLPEVRLLDDESGADRGEERVVDHLRDGEQEPRDDQLHADPLAAGALHALSRHPGHAAPADDADRRVPVADDFDQVADRALNAIATGWISINNAFIVSGAGRWDVQGVEGLDPRGYEVVPIAAPTADCARNERRFTGTCSSIGRTPRLQGNPQRPG